jgi:hypothetical protein
MRDVRTSPIPVAAWPKAWVCCRSVAGIAGRNRQGAWMSVSCDCCVLPGRGLCDGLITRPEEFYQVCVIECIRCNNDPLHLQWVLTKRSLWIKDIRTSMISCRTSFSVPECWLLIISSETTINGSIWGAYIFPLLTQHKICLTPWVSQHLRDRCMIYHSLLWLRCYSTEKTYNVRNDSEEWKVKVVF